jgi:hypothetical protein
MRVNTRRFHRFPYNDLVRVSWQDRLGQVKYANAKCLDVSEQGISVELVEPVELRSYVSLRSDKLKLAGTAAVRYCQRKAGKYMIGLEFSAGLKCSTGTLATTTVA